MSIHSFPEDKHDEEDNSEDNHRNDVWCFPSDVGPKTNRI